MVQRKAPTRLGSETKASEKHGSSHQQQDTRNKASAGSGGNLDLTRKTKKPSPPNYMKPTSSSDARKDRLQQQVTILHSPDITTTTPSVSNNKLVKQSTRSTAGSKPARSLTRDTSLKPMRSSMKKSSGMGLLYPKTNASKPTCSSTLRDSKFPQHMGLNTGGGTDEFQVDSVMKVCPYTYCSLNGHTHEPIPPLKSFLSARRQVIKNQKSMKLKRLSSLMAISRFPTGFEQDPLCKDNGNKFFVEIYDKPRAMQTENFKERPIVVKDPEVLNELSQTEDDWECRMNQKYQSTFDINYNDDVDLIRGLSDEEMDVREDYEEWDFDCYMVNASSTDSEHPVDGEAVIQASVEAIKTGWEEEAGVYPASKTDYSEYLDDGFDPISNTLQEIADAGDRWSFEPENCKFTSEMAGEYRELLHEGEKVIASDNENPAIRIIDYGLYKENGEEVVENYSSTLELQFSDFPQGYTESANDTEEFDCMEIEMEVFSDQSEENNICGNQNRSDNEKHEETSGNKESTPNPSKEDCIGLNDTLQIKDGVSPGEEDCKTLDYTQQLKEAGGERKVRYHMVRMKTTEDVEDLREFNPRSPRFLPLEHDPEAEKVCLRHQLMDERKSSEDWMIDYALQQLVVKLAPTRKRKVELLVEAFETIMPLPVFETSLQAISVFTQARPVQACS